MENGACRSDGEPDGWWNASRCEAAPLAARAVPPFDVSLKIRAIGATLRLPVRGSVCYTDRMQPVSSSKPDIHSEAFLHTLMRRQLRLSIACAASFLVALLGLPLANYFLPELMATR